MFRCVCLMFLTLSSFFAGTVEEVGALNRKGINPAETRPPRWRPEQRVRNLHGVVTKGSLLYVPEVVVRRNTESVTSFFRPLKLAEARSMRGKVTGLKVADLEPSSLFYALGLRPGDQIERVGSRTIRSMGDLFKVYHYFKKSEERRLPVCIIRDGRAHEFVVIKR